MGGFKAYLRRRLAPVIDQRLRWDLASASRITPIDPEADVLVTPAPEPLDVDHPLAFPLPPPELRAGIPDYLQLAEGHVEAVRNAARHAGAPALGRVLDFGCGTGRMTRWLLPEAREDEVWGVDFDARCIQWNQTHLSPPFHFLLCSSLPSLPFEDGYFDLVVGGSVFTHISEMADGWLLELRRVTRPGGLLYLTIQDGAFMEIVQRDNPELWISQLIDAHRDALDRLGRGADVVSVGRRGNDAMVFHDRDALVRRWSAHLDLVDVVEGAYFAQTALVLRKRSP